ncbi:hypothetical protein NQ314_009759 [Rhamnusium bicolor]|uniref:Uncharacterized protein n=1 Tax=Rhamnusium bicolor TaxID=1586634 RepID=A0AAV8XW69_9CUCU|nr:hypothetical protein NQ314_009759 [Rhamnusium bicolor]
MHIPWRKVCGLRYIKEQPSKVFYKTDFEGEFIEVDCRSNSMKNRGRPKQTLIYKAYESTLPISEKKLKNLETMCKDLTIPKAYHNFYQALKNEQECSR